VGNFIPWSENLQNLCHRQGLGDGNIASKLSFLPENNWYPSVAAKRIALAARPAGANSRGNRWCALVMPAWHSTTHSLVFPIGFSLKNSLDKPRRCIEDARAQNWEVLCRFRGEKHAPQDCLPTKATRVSSGESSPSGEERDDDRRQQNRARSTVTCR
jgi:hypothetical protein